MKSMNIKLDRVLNSEYFENFDRFQIDDYDIYCASNYHEIISEHLA